MGISSIFKMLMGQAPKSEGALTKVAKAKPKGEVRVLVDETPIIDQQRHDIGMRLLNLAQENPHLMKYGPDPITLQSMGIETGLFGGPAGASVEFGTPIRYGDSFRKWANGKQGVVFDTLSVEKGVPGSKLYQALWDEVDRGGRVNYSDSLSPVNENRRTDNMLSRGIRDYMENKPVLGSVWLAHDQAKLLGITPEVFSKLHPHEKLGALAQLSRERMMNDRYAAPYYQKFIEDPTYENALTQSGALHNRLKREGPAVAEYNAARAFGPSTMMRGSLIDEFLNRGTMTAPDQPVFYRRGGYV
jgi:hypothetical protein